MTITVKTACLRLARHGIKLANEGDIAGAQALIKTADALALGHAPQAVLDHLFPKEAHEKVAAYIEEVIATPSEVAQIVTLQKKAQAFDEMQKKAAEKAAKKAQKQEKKAAEKKNTLSPQEILKRLI